MLVLVFLLIITGIPMGIITLPIMQRLQEVGFLPSWIPLPPSAKKLQDHWIS